MKINTGELSYNTLILEEDGIETVFDLTGLVTAGDILTAYPNLDSTIIDKIVLARTNVDTRICPVPYQVVIRSNEIPRVYPDFTVLLLANPNGFIRIIHKSIINREISFSIQPRSDYRISGLTINGIDSFSLITNDKGQSILYNLPTNNNLFTIIVSFSL